MPYAQAVTMIDELPPIIQLPTMQHQPPPPPRSFQENPYYEEVIRKHPNVQSKIRQLDHTPFGKYPETMSPAEPAVPVWDNIPDYPINRQPPSSVEQNYLPASMKARVQTQHLPIAPHIPTRYEQPMVDGSPTHNYPVVENYLNCRDIMAHISGCPICSGLYHKNDRIYLAAISVLILLIFVIVFRFSRKH